MDCLMKSAKAFERLLCHEYEITAGSKQKLIKLSLFFGKNILHIWLDYIN